MTLTKHQMLEKKENQPELSQTDMPTFWWSLLSKYSNIEVLGPKCQHVMAFGTWYHHAWVLGPPGQYRQTKSRECRLLRLIILYIVPSMSFHVNLGEGMLRWCLGPVIYRQAIDIRLRLAVGRQSLAAMGSQ